MVDFDGLDEHEPTNEWQRGDGGELVPHVAPAGLASGTFTRPVTIEVPVEAIEDATLFYSEVLAQSGIRITAGQHDFDLGAAVLSIRDVLTKDAVSSPDRATVQAIDALGAIQRHAARMHTEVGDSRRVWQWRDPVGNRTVEQMLEARERLVPTVAIEPAPARAEYVESAAEELIDRVLKSLELDVDPPALADEPITLVRDIPPCPARSRSGFWIATGIVGAALASTLVGFVAAGPGLDRPSDVAVEPRRPTIRSAAIEAAVLPSRPVVAAPPEAGPVVVLPEDTRPTPPTVSATKRTPRAPARLVGGASPVRR